MKSFDVTLSDPKCMSDHPHGEIIVDRREVGATIPSFKYHDAQIMKEPTDPTGMLKELGKIYQQSKFNRNIVFHC